MSCLDVPIQTILGTECIGDSLPKIMGNFNTLGDATCDLITDVNALSAYAANLQTLIQSLSTNMQNIGNYPYLEYAYVTTCNYTGQLIDNTASGILQTVYINTKVHDTHSIGSNPSSNIISLPQGTYEYNLIVPFALNPSTWANVHQTSLLTYLMNGSTPIAIERVEFKIAHNTGLGRNVITNMSGRFKITSTSNITVQTKMANGDSSDIIIGLSNNSGNDENFSGTGGSDPAWVTRLKLWKVG